MLADQDLELLDHLGVAAERELRLDQLLQRRAPQVIQASDLREGKRLVGEVRQRIPAPQRQRLLERSDGRVGAVAGKLGAAPGEEPLEAVRVELLGIERQLVAALARDDRAVAAASVRARQRLAQTRDVHLQRLGRAGGRMLPPQRVDQAVRGERLVGVEQQQREQRARLGPRKREAAAVVEDLERAEDAEVHADAVTTVWLSGYRCVA